MDKMLVAVFDSERQAYEGLSILKALDQEGTITVFATAVIAKDEKRIVSVKEAAEQGPLGTAVGLVTGSLLGLLAGPVGFAIAAGAGTLGGVLYDLAKVGVNEDFLTEVGQRLGPGKVAVLAQIAEEWVTPVDTRIEAAGGIIYRRVRGEVVDAQIERDLAAFESELAALKAEHARAAKEEKARLEAKIDAAKANLRAAQGRAKAAIDASVKEGEAKVKALQAKMAKARGDAKAKVEKRIADTQAEYQRRSSLMSQAWDLAKQALAA